MKTTKKNMKRRNIKQLQEKIKTPKKLQNEKIQKQELKKFTI